MTQTHKNDQNQNLIIQHFYCMSEAFYTLEYQSFHEQTSILWVSYITGNAQCLTKGSNIADNWYQYITTALRVLVGEVFNLDTQEGDGGHLTGISKWEWTSCLFVSLFRIICNNIGTLSSHNKTDSWETILPYFVQYSRTIIIYQDYIFI